MRLVLLLAAALMLAGLGSATVYTFTAAQFEAMVAGLPIPGVDSASDAGYGRRHTGVWVVRFTMPWETVGHNRTNDFVVASDLVPSAIARFAELPINTVDELFIADTLSVSLPEIRAFNGPVARLEIPRGTVFPSDRPSRPVARYVATPGEELASLVRFVFDNVPSSYEEESTSEVVASMRVFSTKKDLLSALQLAQREASGLAHATPAVAKAATLSHVAVALSSKDPFTRAQVLAAALAAGTMNRGRGGGRVFVITGAGFSDVALTGFDFTVATVSLSGDKSDFTLSNAVGGKSLDDIAHRAFALADAIESVEEVKQHAKSVLTAARAGATRYLAPVDLDRPQRHPLRRLDTTEQFMKEVVELKNGVAVVFFLRESDKFYSKHLKIAKKLAEMTVRDFSANVPGQENVQRRYDVFLVDAEVHKNVARDLRVDKVPSVACLIGLRDHPDKKGLRFYKSKDGLDKPEAINKWMRTDIFDGRDTAIVDPYVVRFSSPVPASTLDLSLQTEYFDTNPRRFHYAPTSTPDLYTQTLDDAKSATGSPLNVNAQKKDTGKGAKAQESAKEAAQREKVAAKQRELAEKRKAKLKEELEAKEAAKKKKMADKEAVEKSAAEKRKAEAEQRAKEEAERRAREEADGTAERRRAAAKAKKARAERAAKLKKAKLAAKEKKDRATLMKLWAEDAAVAAQKHSFVGADGEVRIVDRIL